MRNILNIYNRFLTQYPEFIFRFEIKYDPDVPINNWQCHITPNNGPENCINETWWHYGESPDEVFIEAILDTKKRVDNYKEYRRKFKQDMLYVIKKLKSLPRKSD